MLIVYTYVHDNNMSPRCNDFFMTSSPLHGRSVSFDESHRAIYYLKLLLLFDTNSFEPDMILILSNDMHDIIDFKGVHA